MDPTTKYLALAALTLALGYRLTSRSKRSKSRDDRKTTPAQPTMTTTTATATTSSSSTSSSKAKTTNNNAPPIEATSAVLVPGNEIPDTPVVAGYDFAEEKVDWEKLVRCYFTTGYQALHLGKGIMEINRMISWRLSQEPILPDDDITDAAEREKVRCKIFLGYTSNLISSGLRETFCYLAKNKMVDVIVSSAGGIEEDFIKCLAPTYTGEFNLNGAELRSKGLNRIGNLLVPNSNYCKFEDWITPILDQMLVEQNTQGVRWTPSKMIHRLGKEINHPESVYYWCYKNNIPVYCPALTDGSIGDMLYFMTYRNEGLVLDVVEDVRRMNDEAVKERKTGMIVLGGGVVKHHIFNANLMRNGADFVCLVNTAQEFDGSDGGAALEESVSWGKVRVNKGGVKICADATIVFPLIVAATFKANEKSAKRV